MGAAASLDRWRVAAGDLLLGASCHGCGAAAWTLCDDCRGDLAAQSARPTQPEPCPPDFPETWTAGSYDDLARGLVSAHKERAALGLTRVLGERLALAVLALVDEGTADDREVARAPLLLVPVPSSRRAVRERGFDAGLALARAAARRLPEARAAPLLVPVRRVADQSGLGAEQRHANLSGAFRARAGRRARAVRGGGAVVVVVDDVVTSGASLTEAARALRTAGVDVRGAATVAATVRRHAARPAPAVRRGAGWATPAGATGHHERGGDRTDG